MLDCCVKCEEYTKMNEIFKILQENEVHNKSPLSDLITYSTLIKGYAKEKNTEAMMKIYNLVKGKQEKNELQLDEVFYNTILDGCAKNDKVNLAFQIVSEMRKNGIVLSNVTYSIIIKLHSKANEYAKTLEVFEEMKRNKVTPGLVVYTCLIQNCIKNKDIDKAIQLFETAKKIKKSHPTT